MTEEYDNLIDTETVDTAFFGQYLLQSGVITEDQLQESLALQARHNQKLGEMAVDRGYLSEAQVEEVTRDQKLLDLPLGVIATRKGYLSPEQLDDLLFSQIVDTIHVGEALVELGHVPASDLARLLNTFNTHDRDRQRLIEEKLRHLPHSSLIVAGIESLQRAFLRIAQKPTTIVSVYGSFATESTWTFLVWMQMESGTFIHMAASLTENNALSIAASLAPHRKKTDCDQCCLGWNNLFFTIVKRYYRALLLKENLKVVRSGAGRAQAGWEPRPTEDACVTLASPVGLIQVRFFFTPCQTESGEHEGMRPGRI